MIKNTKTSVQNLSISPENLSGQVADIKMGKVYPVCYRCAQVPKNGLYDGFRLRGMFFCSECQHELYTAEPDSPEYQEFLFLIQGLLF
jgi:hypothetical protein